jgi:ring-1,2-phenylacetyl-CoA epoxidase subunit PaaA
MALVTAPTSDADVAARIRDGKLIESVEQMSPAYLEGIIRILTVSADTELISARRITTPVGMLRR